MRTIRIKAYKFDELSSEAKDTALQNNSYDAEYDWQHEALASLFKGAEYFYSPVIDYQIDWLNGRSSNQVAFDTNGTELSEKELEALIMNMGSFDPETHKGLGDCKFTGYCADEDFCDGIRSAWFEGERDLTELLYAGFNSWYAAANRDFEYQLSAEGYSDFCENNNIEFTKEGKLL